MDKFARANKFCAVTPNIFITITAVFVPYIRICGPGSVVRIATAYGLDGPGIESRWGRDFPTRTDRP